MRKKCLIRDERGQSYVILLIALPLMLLLIALLVDGGRMFYEYVKLRNVAALAAQAGAQAVDGDYFAATNEVFLNVDGAIYLERQAMTLNAGRLPGEVDVWYFPTTGEGRICVRERLPTYFWHVFGRAEIAPAACSRARPAYGIEQEWQ